MTPLSLLAYNAGMNFLLCLLVLICAHSASAEDSVINTTEYTSAVDDDLTIQTMSLLPSSDNLQGIYARPIDARLQDFITKNHRWEFIASDLISSKIKPETLVGAPKKVLAFSKNMKADAFLSAQARKDPSGLQLSLYLFSNKSGRLIAEEREVKLGEDTPSVLKALNKMLQKLVNRIPYDGLIVSRTDQRVTINLGSKDGIKAGQLVPVFKIINAKRHPKRDFIIKTNKAILGQVRVVKVDEYISFGDITTENEAGVVTSGAKLAALSQVTYKPTQWTKTYTPPEVLLSEDNNIVYGKRPKAWVPVNPPTFGKIGARLGLGSFNNNLSLQSGLSYESQVPVYPKVDIEGEIWMSPEWYINGSMSQGLASSSNPNGGTPSSLSLTLSQYRMSVGYNFLLKNNFFGPKFSVDLGVSHYQMFVDNTTPLSFTTLAYTSFPLGVGAYVPVTNSQKWAIEGKVYFHLFPSLRETPFNSGDASNTVNQLLFYGIHKWSERLRLKGGLEALILSTSFSGTGSRPDGPGRNLSQRHLMLLLGCDYLF